ncbi:RNA polymerase sigma factor, partial [Nostocoides australiense]|uniref:RNA polymerase sigma factor n=1 Tax=Nostocoides australiense TaxID=99480 RepID=UPI0012ED19F0
PPAPPPPGHDIAAEVYAVAWRRLADVPADDPRPWLFAVARNVLLGAARGRRRRGALAVRVAMQPGDAAAGDVDDLAVTRADIVRAWVRLTPDEQETLALTVWERLDASAAAQVLGISPTAYRMRLSRARQALRAHLDGRPHHVSATKENRHER